MLEKVEGAQADLLCNLRTELEDSNKGLLNKSTHCVGSVAVIQMCKFQTQLRPP